MSQKYLYPVRPETIKDFIEKIIISISKDQCLTFTKGLRAWFRFALISYSKEAGLVDKLKNYQISYFETVDVLEYSKAGFFFQLLNIISPDSKLKYEDISLHEIINKIEASIEAILKKKDKLIIFIPKLNAFPNFDFEYGNILYKIWKRDKSRILFIISLSNVEVYKYANDNCGEFKEALLQNVEKVSKLSKEDILYSSLHWCEILNINLPAKILNEIVKLSDGSASKSKMLVQTASRNLNLVEKDLIDLLKNTINDFNKLFSSNEIKLNGERIFLEENDITLTFTSAEYQILKVLIKNKDKIVTREEIAFVVWGDQQYEKYSDWAIDKFISQIRQKLNAHYFNGELRAFRGKGFKLMLPLSNES
jgi:DNA-binding winged helix-turn-helix (wHTH) protein